MNRDFIYGNSYNSINYPTNQPPGPRQEFHMYSPEIRKQNEPDLIIYNGQQPVKDIFNPQQNAYKSNLAFVPQRINKNPSQKAFPIIYNTYNDGGATQPQIKLQTFNANYASKTLIRHQPNDYDAFNENNHSNLSEKQQKYHNYRQQQTSQANQFHTFQHIPPESEPQTAKFLQLPDKLTSENYFMSSQTEPYRPPSEMHFENRHYAPTSPPIYSFQPMPTHIPPIKSQSRLIQRPNIPISPTNRVIYQEPPPQRLMSNYVEEKPKLISIPHDQYERYVQNMAHCKRNQDESQLAKTKIQQLSQKEHFYWQQNMTLREENKRLRDLVTHFEKRQKELLRERQQQKHTFEQQILKYRDSTLEQFRLLIERYKLQMQKKK